MLRSTLLYYFCESGSSCKFSDLTELRDIDHFIVKFKLHSYIWFQAPDFVILESKLCFSGVVSNFQVVIQSASSNATVHSDRGSKFRDFQFSVFLREPRASFSGISARSLLQKHRVCEPLRFLLLLAALGGCLSRSSATFSL